MSAALSWCGFAGAWLLVAGPVYQAAVELEEEDFDRDELVAASERIDPGPRVSPWWWLLPPVAYLKRRRRTEAQRQLMLRDMEADQVERLMHFGQTAIGWLYVAAGAFLIAVKETFDLREAYEWPDAAAWGLIVLMPALSAVNTAVRLRRRDAILARAGGD